MTPEQPSQLGQLLKARRKACGLSTRRLARDAKMNPTTVMRMETGSIAAPGLDKLARIAQVLGISGADVFALAGYTVPADLPRLRPYFYAKYPGLQGEDLDKIETYVARLARKRGVEPVEAANRDAETPER